MTYQSGLPPWFAMATPLANTNYSLMEPLALNPRLVKQPAAQRTARERQVRPGPQARRASQQQVHAKLVQAVQEQPRDQQGRFAEKGKWFSRLFDPTPRPPTRLKPLRQAMQKHPITVPPRARARKNRRKKPVPERGFFGKVFALFNGDYAKWRMKNLREQARLRAQIDGYYVPKKRVRQRRKLHSTKPARPPRKRGIVRRILGL